MKLLKGDLWSEVGRADLILFTANSTLDKNGCLVMGAGAAKEAKKLFPTAPRRLGDLVAIRGAHYGVVGIQVNMETDHWIGAFQTKSNWREPSELAIIERSVERLLPRCTRFNRIALNFPGIGLGQLKRSDVLPLLEVLPDNVYIYELD